MTQYYFFFFFSELVNRFSHNAKLPFNGTFRF